MDRSVFTRHFMEAAAQTRDFARKFIEEPLPDAMRFRVHLNMSHDANAAAVFRLFPEDSSATRELETKNLAAEDVVDLLFRDGYVPQWVDLSVGGETGRETVIDVVACRRFIDDEQRLYYAHTGIAPFSPKGPSLPVGHVEGARFSIHDRSSCWTLDDLERAQRKADKVWSLELRGPIFDDQTMAVALGFPRLEILELVGVRLQGPGLTALRDLPRLRHLRVRFGDIPEFALADLPVLAKLDTLVLSCLPPRLSSPARLVDALPSLKELTLGSTRRVRVDGELALRRLDDLTLELPAIPAWVIMPAALRSLTLCASEATDDDVRKALASTPITLESLVLRGTPASDAVFHELERLRAVNYLDAVDTRITLDALRHLSLERPGLKCWPRLDAL